LIFVSSAARSLAVQIIGATGSFACSGAVTIAATVTRASVRRCMGRF
jgi:hypothetical protein